MNIKGFADQFVSPSNLLFAIVVLGGVIWHGATVENHIAEFEAKTDREIERILKENERRDPVIRSTEVSLSVIEAQITRIHDDISKIEQKIDRALSRGR